MISLLLKNKDSFGIKLPMKIDMTLNKETKPKFKLPSNTICNNPEMNF